MNINAISFRKKITTSIIWLIVAVTGAAAAGGIALNRGESINSLWFIVAAICFYLIGFRFYSAFIAAKVLVLDSTRATPAERLNDGRDFVPTNRWIVFGHHFAAIAGPGPLIGPTLAAQFGYLPGTLWILIGAVLGGCVQDVHEGTLLVEERETSGEHRRQVLQRVCLAGADGPEDRDRPLLVEVGSDHLLQSEGLAGDLGEDARHDDRPLPPNHSLPL